LAEGVLTRGGISGKTNSVDYLLFGKSTVEEAIDEKIEREEKKAKG